MDPKNHIKRETLNAAVHLSHKKRRRHSSNISYTCLLSLYLISCVVTRLEQFNMYIIQVTFKSKNAFMQLMTFT